MGLLKLSVKLSVAIQMINSLVTTKVDNKLLINDLGIFPDTS